MRQNTSIMVGLSRKQREIQDREAQILEVARGHLLDGGYLGLSMDRIAAQMEYSKGTIYQHFRNKEEILIALANEALHLRTTMFERASLFPGTSRERVAAIGAAAEAFVETAPHYFMVEQIVRASSIWEKTSAERQEVMRMCERRCMAIVGGIARDAVAHGDLSLPEGVRPEEVVFGMWSIYLGAQTISSSSDTLGEIGIHSPLTALRRGQNKMLDGYGWRPLSGEADYDAHMDRVKQELFSDA
ncbi:MAG: TetR/AcrR family transcriptional regulator [Planctomycetota bacterium]